MAKKRVCVSFDYENDGHLKSLLAAWNKNPNIAFSFDDKTPKEIQSSDYSVIKVFLPGVFNTDLGDPAPSCWR